MVKLESHHPSDHLRYLSLVINTKHMRTQFTVILDLNTITNQLFARRTPYTWWRIIKLHYTRVIFGEKNITYVHCYIQKSMDS